MILIVAARAAEMPVGSTPPSIYRQQIESLLTPVDAVLEFPVTAATSGDSGIILLDERLVAVDEEGRRTVAWHFAYKTLADAGIKTNGEDVYRFNKREQKAYLLLAETIQPDGTRHPVQPNAVLLQSPQRQAQYSLYDDQAELKIIFPDVRVGSVTHGIVVIEDLAGTVPGEFCQNFSWGSSWASARIHYALNLPKALDARLKVETLGAGAPVRQTTAAGPGRVTHSWTLSEVAGERYEPGRPPASQVGPAVQLSTVADWAAIGSWYRGLLGGRGVLKPELAHQVDEWCQDAASPADTLAILHARIADDIRYVGLEFGAAAYQPHDCNEVWSLRYGDCKDKANLLVAMLRHRGLKAGIALVNTDHLGLVNRRVPSYQLFDHAIVAVAQPDGSFLYCDPTIMFSTPGMLATSAADRDVFVVTDTEATWARTPPSTTGSLRYSFDLKLTETGELAGWFTATGEGLYGAYERRRYTRLEPQDVRYTLSDVIRGFYPGAELIDTTRVASDRSDPYTVKAYFTVPGTNQDASSRHALTFPGVSGLLPNLGKTAERQSTYFLERERIQLSATIALPAGYQAPKVQPEFRVDAGSAKLRAGWIATDGSCRAELDLEMKDVAVRRDEFGRLYQARQSLLAWLERPLLLEAGAAANENAATADIDFPLMPTGEGQIALVDSRYPAEGNAESRRLALERTIQFFPQDPNTVFRASGRLAVLDWNQDHNEAAHERLARLLPAYAGQVTAENYAWAQNIEGLVLRDLGREAEALAILGAVSRDNRVSVSRRANAAAEAALLLAKTDASAAITLLEEIAALPEGATTAVESRLARLYLESARAADLTSHLQEIAHRRPDSAEDEFTRLLDASSRWPESSAIETPGQQLAAMIATLVPQPGDGLREKLAEISTNTGIRRVRLALTDAVARVPLAEWNTAAAAQTFAQYDQAIADADEQKDGVAGFRASLQALVHFGSDPEFPQRLWRAANYADWAERQQVVPVAPAVADALLELCDQLPPTHDYYFEGKLLRASRLQRAGDSNAVFSLLEPLLKSPGLPENYFLAITRRLGTARESQGDYAGAARQYSTLEALVPTYRSAAESVLRATFIHLHLGQDADARHTLEVLQQAPAEIMQKMAGGGQVRELLALLKSGQAESVWRHGRQWWPQWRKFAEPFIGPTDSAGSIVPVIDDLVALGQELGVAKRDKDNATYFKVLDQGLGAARWLPSYGTEISSLYTFTAGVVPAQAAEFRAIIVALLEAPHPPEIDHAAATRIQLAIHYIDGGEAAKALPVARAFIGQPPADGEAMVPAMARLWGLAAQAAKTDLPEATAALEKVLADPKSAEYRSAGVTILADLYRQQNRLAEEQTLLRREIANPVIAGTPASIKPLEARLETLSGELDLAQEVERWRVALGLPWYDYADPATLDDPRLKDLAAVLGDPDKFFVPVEKVKLFLLAAQDDQLGLVQRQSSLRSAVNLLLLSAPTWSRFEKEAGSVVDNPAFDMETRVSTLWLTLVYSASGNRFEIYRHWRQHSLFERFSEAYRANVAILDAWVDHDPYSADSLLELADQQGKAGVTAFRGFLLTDILNALINLGDFAAADKFLAMMTTWQPASDFKGTLQARHLEYTRQLRVAKMQARVHERLATLVRERFPALAPDLPAAYADLRFGDTMPTCSPAETVEACLHLIATRRFDRRDFDFWGTLIRNLPRTPETDAFACALMAGAMTAAETDELKSQVLGVFTANVDLDEPAVQLAVTQILADGLDPKKFPATALQAKLGALRLADRQGTLGDLDAFFLGETSPMIPFVKQAQNLSTHLRTRDRDALHRDVDGLDTRLMLDPSFAADVVPALELLDRKEELAATREVVRVELKKAVAQSWFNHDSLTISKVGRYAEVLDDPALVPPAWGSDLSRALTDPFKRLEVRIIAAFVHRDWETLAQASAEMNRDYPTHYHFYWWRAVGEEKRGQVQAAREALKVYIQYCRDERQHPEAVAKLEAIEKTSPSQ